MRQWNTFGQQYVASGILMHTHAVSYKVLCDRKLAPFRFPSPVSVSVSASVTVAVAVK